MDLSILNEATEILGGSRNSDYGDYVKNFEKISEITELLTGRSILAEDCVAVLIAVKLVRESYKHKRDNLVDLCGYAQIWNDVKVSHA